MFNRGAVGFKVGVILAVTLTLSACGQQTVGGVSVRDRLEGSSKTQTPVMVADDPMADSSLAEVGRASDFIGIGVASATPDPVVFGEGSGGLSYTRFELELERIIKGGPQSDSVSVLMITATEDGRPLVVEGRPDLTDQVSVWMLRSVPPEFGRPEGEFVLTSLGGLVPGSQGRRVATSEVDTLAYREAAALQTIDNVAQYLSDHAPSRA